MCVKLVHVHQPSDLEYERCELPYIESCKEDEEEESKSGEPVETSAWCPKRTISLHLLGDALVDNYVRQPGDMLWSDSRIFNASQKERGKTNDKSHCAGENV